MRADGEMIANLNGIGATETLLLDDIGNRLPRGQQKCPDGRRNSRCNLCDQRIADDARPARHA